MVGNPPPARTYADASPRILMSSARHGRRRFFTGAAAPPPALTPSRGFYRSRGPTPRSPRSRVALARAAGAAPGRIQNRASQTDPLLIESRREGNPYATSFFHHAVSPFHRWTAHHRSVSGATTGRPRRRRRTIGRWRPCARNRRAHERDAETGRLLPDLLGRAHRIAVSGNPAARHRVPAFNRTRRRPRIERHRPRSRTRRSGPRRQVRAHRSENPVDARQPIVPLEQHEWGRAHVG